MEIGKELVTLCREKKNLEAIDKFYSPAVESIEAEAIPQIGKVQKGIDKPIRAIAISPDHNLLAAAGHDNSLHFWHLGKGNWMNSGVRVNSQIATITTMRYFPNGDQFIIHFTYDVTPKQSGKRMSMSEMGLYTVRDGKIAKEEFFYAM